MYRALTRAASLQIAAAQSVRSEITIYNNMSGTFGTLRGRYAHLFAYLDNLYGAFAREPTRSVPPAPDEGLFTPARTQAPRSATPTHEQTIDSAATPLDFEPTDHNRTLAEDVRALQDDTSAAAEAFRFMFATILSKIETNHLPPQTLEFS